MMLAGHVVISPIAHSHPLFVRRPEVGAHFEQWRELDQSLIAACAEMWILNLPGWDQSYGVSEEAKFSRERGIPVRLVDEFGKAVEEV